MSTHCEIKFVVRDGLMIVTAGQQVVVIDPSIVRAITTPPLPGASGMWALSASMLMFQGGGVVMTEVTVQQMTEGLIWARAMKEDGEKPGQMMTGPKLV